MHVTIYDPGTRLYPPRVALASRTPVNQQSANRVGVPTSYEVVSTGGNTIFAPGVGVVDVWNDSDPRMGSYPPRVALAPRTPVNQRSANGSFHTVGGGLDPRDHGFRPHIFRIVDVWKDF